MKYICEKLSHSQSEGMKVRQNKGVGLFYL